MRFEVSFWSVLAALLLGAAAGLGGFTMNYAEGLSYFSRDPSACANCHIMQPQYDSWQKASHHISADCVDCHLPQSGLAKWVAKARNGWNHSKGFTMQDFDEPIRPDATSSRVLEANCLRCHGDLVHDWVELRGAEPTAGCVRCHETVGHGPRAGLGGSRLTERFEP